MKRIKGSHTIYGVKKVLFLISSFFLLVSCQNGIKSNGDADTVDTIKIVISADGASGYAQPKIAPLDVLSATGKDMVSFNLVQEGTGKSIDSDMTLKFVNPEPTSDAKCKNPVPWKDGKKIKKMKKNDRKIKLNKSNHKIGNCYTYELIVHTKPGNPSGDIIIDPWIRIHR